ncbi:CHAT domain-containing protein [Paenarthrobacter nicotinovorans]|uniref:CHAT domain-containing protein n=2 Tax=Paenarthrobacter TaxID=1742992 RepID=UPI003818DA28
MEEQSKSMTWLRWFDIAVSLGNQRRAAEMLAELILADSVLLLSPDDPQPTYLPEGQPPKSVLRAAGTKLIELSDAAARDDTADAWRSLGLIAKTCRPQRQGDDDSELFQATRSAEEAARLALGTDPVIECFALQRLSTWQRDVFLLQESLETAERMAEIASQGLSSKEEFVLPALLPEASWLSDPSLQLRAFKVSAHARSAIAARFLSAIPRAIAEREKQVHAAEALSTQRPGTLADALGQRALLARHIGDVRTSIAVLDKQSQHCTKYPTFESTSVMHRSQAAQARFLDDWAAERQHLLARLVVALGAENEDGVKAEPQSVMDAVDRLYALDRGRSLRAIGNIAFELGRNLIDSGLVSDDPVASKEAEGWLDCALWAWRDIAMNGKVAVEFRALELAAIQGKGGPADEIGRRMLESSRAWRRPVGRRRAAIKAAEFGAAGDPAILERLEELHKEASNIDAAHLAAGLALWHLRAGDAADSRRVTLWQTAVQYSDEAVAGLSLEGPGPAVVLLDAPAYVGALQTKAEALQRLAMRAEIGDRAQELRVRIQTLPGIARRVSTASTAEQKRAVWNTYAGWLVDTAVLAVELQDSKAADIVAEVARRDTVGVVLRSMSEAPELARLARQLTATLRAVSAAADPDEVPPQIPRESKDQARSVATQLDETLDVVGTVVGPVARALFDPEAVLSASAQKVLDRTAAPSAAVLSLWLMAGNRLMRRLVWRAPDGRVSETLDITDAPAYLGALSPNAARNPDVLDAQLRHARDVLLPASLLSLLRQSDSDYPLALTIVPTGLLDVPFAALEVDDKCLLLDVASITLIQSLQTALSLGTDQPGEDPALHLASFDTDRFSHAKSELEALRCHVPHVREANSLEDLRQSLNALDRRGNEGLLVLALHGIAGNDGWSQAKVLPSGEHLTTAHVLQWSMPRLVVGPSCYTGIHADYMGEMGGFPLAFQLRGASHVIGTLTEVYDEATSQIMAHFYAYIAGGVEPAAALRLAQRAWIAVDPADRLPRIELWSYLVAYGLPEGVVR